MHVTRLFTGQDGESHFEDSDLPLRDIGGSEQRSAPLPATGLIFRETGAGYDWQWHNAPCRQFVITLQGNAEIVVGDGTVRHFGPGDILLAEDTTGHGHITRAVDAQPRTSIFITLE